MFKTILVPTDGSELSEKAINAAVEFATGVDGRVIGISVAPPYPFSPLSEYSMGENAQVFEEKSRNFAQQYVDKVAEIANKANVRCDKVTALSFSPYEEILKAAKDFQCDVIFMASHGRTGLTRLFVGSETQKVLMHSTIPVLVFR
jgi:nucleotide-binding universal stress UspA family protein